MSQENTKKRNKGRTGIKSLIAGASVAATIAGWAMLPANDPQATAASTAPPAITAPAAQPDSGFTSTLPLPADTQAPTQSDAGLPQNSLGQPAPFRRSHSSR